ncbi:hypothetical protein AMATHDRAFT_6813 [Amanita thiersii Skay4041]|uniref:Uncharacterized protein n=1 Tax=Amanita thiersii Skay4041 TaxID=703135 RepID=A0A2A9NI50_9AGAR|nr:hypothetical protein AMATHDRAFT_6813 [Amanita thiersii Skay4041]
MPTRKPYNGSQRKLLIAFDVGTTFSGISYSVLDPGAIPEIFGVTRFPAQQVGDSKIPTVVYYDRKGEVRAVGAEAVQEGIDEIAEDEGWVKAEWFKLHLRPKDLNMEGAIPPLPTNKTAIDIFADFLRYLHTCTKIYIEDSHAAGQDLWSSLENQTHYVLTHPNGWLGLQQSQMKQAAIKAGLVSNAYEADSRISFLTEGEASLNYCVCNGISTEAFKDGRGVIVVDAGSDQSLHTYSVLTPKHLGGGTVDLSAYAQVSALHNTYEEIAIPQCYLKGSVFVTHFAHKFFEGKLKFLRGSRYSDPQQIKLITKVFDTATKLAFRGRIEDPMFIRFGSLADNDEKLNIRRGQLKLSGSTVGEFFEPSIRCMLEAVRSQKQAATKSIHSVFLVGGFSRNDWVFQRLKDGLQPLGISVSRPDGHVSKAVANGAISFYLDHYVNSRIARYTYGNPCSYIFNPNNPEHQVRSGQVYVSASKKRYIKGAFDIILARGTQVSETTEFRRSYWYTKTSREEMTYVKNEVLCYRGTVKDPRWMDVDKDNYVKLCTIEADTTRLSQLVQPQKPTTGKRKNKRLFFELNYDIILSFGLTELKAQIAWTENGQEVRSPARVIYDA